MGFCSRGCHINTPPPPPIGTGLAIAAINKLPKLAFHDELSTLKYFLYLSLFNQFNKVYFLTKNKHSTVHYIQVWVNVKDYWEKMLFLNAALDIDLF